MPTETAVIHQIESNHNRQYTESSLGLFGNNGNHVIRLDSHSLWRFIKGQRLPRFVVIGGGSGPVSIEDGLLERTPYVVGGTGIHDRGGHSKELRTILGTCAPGDLTHRFAVHLRNPRMRSLFMHRWKLPIEGHPMNGHRPVNEMFAAAEIQEGSPSEAARLLEEMFNPRDYKGRVMPATDDPVDIRARYTDGSFIDYEDQIGERETGTPAIETIEFMPSPPRANRELLRAIRQGDAVVAASTSFWTSQMPIFMIPEISEAIRQSPAIFIWICNAFTNLSETDGYKASDFARRLVDVIGRKIDIALVNRPDHWIPEGYSKARSYQVEPDTKNCHPYAKHIYTGSFTGLYKIDGKSTVRHNGDLVGDVLVEGVRRYPKPLSPKFLAEHDLELYLQAA